MRRLTRIRHVQTAWNAAGRTVGATALHRTAEGIRQARRLRCRLQSERVTCAYIGDLQRAVTPAHSSRAVHRDMPVALRTALREMDFGGAEGAPHPGTASHAMTLLAMHASRVRARLRELAEGICDGRWLVVAHEGPRRVLLCLQPEQHWRCRLDCGSSAVPDSAPGHATRTLLNDGHHVENQR